MLVWFKCFLQVMDNGIVTNNTKSVYIFENHNDGK